MSSLDDILTNVGLLARLGRWAEATEKLREAIANGGGDASLPRTLAGILAAQGKFAEAVKEYEDLIAAGRGDAALICELADIHWALDQHEPALRLLRDAREPESNAGMSFRLGRVLVALDRRVEAVPFLKIANESEIPSRIYTEIWRWLLRALVVVDPEEARRQIRAKDPHSCGSAEAAIDVVGVANELNEPALAEAWCRAAIALDPDHGPAWFLLGVAAMRSGRRSEALDALLRAGDLMPESDEIHATIVSAALEVGRLNEVRSYVERLRSKRPIGVPDLLIAGLAAHRLGDKAGALSLLAQAAAEGPKNGAIEDAAIGELMDAAMRSELAPFVDGLRAKSAFDDEALRLYAYRSLYLADWRDRESLKRRYAAGLARWVAEGHAQCNMLWTLAAFGFDYLADLTVCRALAARYVKPAASLAARPRRDKIRVGWLQVASGFHSTQMATLNLVRRADRSRFEVFGYSRRDQTYQPGHVNYGFQRDFRSQFSVFRDLSDMDDDTAAETLRRDDLDVLFEMQGLNDNNSMGIMARRPARVSAVYYGFSHSTGADFVDYLIADREFLPPSMLGIGTEKIVFVPGCHMAPTLGDFHPSAIERSAVGLPEDAVVLCNFNNPWKHDPDSFASWMRILKAVPGTVLWLARWNDTSVENLKDEARSAGVDPSRLIFGSLASHPMHLKRLQLADLALNSFYVGGGVTSLDTLWAGVPMITTRGMADAPSAHLGASMLLAAGLGELVVESPEAYEALAMALCRDRPRLAALKNHLLTGRNDIPLFDIDAAARHIDRAAELMFENWAAGRPPRDLEIEPMWTKDRRGAASGRGGS